MNVSKKGNIDFTKGSIIRNLILIPFYLVMVVLRQLFLAIVMRHPRIEYIYAAFPLGWGPPAAETGKELPLRDGSSFPLL